MLINSHAALVSTVRGSKIPQSLEKPLKASGVACWSPAARTTEERGGVVTKGIRNCFSYTSRARPLLALTGCLEFI